MIEYDGMIYYTFLGHGRLAQRRAVCLWHNIQAMCNPLVPNAQTEREGSLMIMQHVFGRHESIPKHVRTYGAVA
jgi:hypothetical protein